MGCAAAQAHPGGLNREDCHNNRKTGDYRCHGGGRSRDRKAVEVFLMRETAERRPYLDFSTIGAAVDIPVECLERDGTITRWDANLLLQLPGWRPDCRC